MEPCCIRYTEVPGSTRLFLDFTYHFDRVAAFYPHHYQATEAFAQAASEVHYPEDRRKALVSALRSLNGENPQLQRLAAPGTFAVVTGQQVGLFGGPIYTIYKALTAARLAESLTAAGLPSVAVFWLATEDHDFEEISHCWVFDEGTQPQALRVEADSGHRPAGLIAPGGYPAAELDQLLRDFPFRSEVMDLVETCYRRGRTMGEAFFGLIRPLLDRYGFLFIDPMQAEVRRLAAPLLEETAHRGDELTDLLLERNRQLEAAGYHAQVHFEAKNSLLFLLAEGRRVPLRRRGRTYEGETGIYSASDLAAHKERLSPNALLRPVMQDYLLPTVAQVAGPAELAYLAQSQVLYQALLGRAPVVQPRNGFTLLERRAGKLIDRYGLRYGDFLQGPAAVRQRISERLIPPELHKSMSATRESVETLLEAAKRGLGAFDPTLEKAAAKSEAKILHQLSKLRAKAERESLRRDQRARADADYLSGLLYPNKHLHERVYSILPFLARHGPGLMDHISRHIRLDCPDHVVLPV